MQRIRRLREGEVAESYLEKVLGNEANVLLVAEVKSEPAGYLYAHWLDRLRSEERQLFVYDLEVGAPYRRRGVGTGLMECALEMARAEGADAFVFTNHSNDSAMALYEKVGGQAVNGDDLLFKYSYER